MSIQKLEDTEHLDEQSLLVLDTVEWTHRTDWKVASIFHCDNGSLSAEKLSVAGTLLQVFHSAYVVAPVVMFQGHSLEAHFQEQASVDQPGCEN